MEHHHSYHKDQIGNIMKEANLKCRSILRWPSGQ